MCEVSGIYSFDCIWTMSHTLAYVYIHDVSTTFLFLLSTSKSSAVMKY